MRRLIQHTVQVLTLVALLISTSGWVLHRHWCPEGQEHVLSWNGPQDCGMEAMAALATAEKSCCQAPASQPIMGCEEAEGCCQDAAIRLQLTAPFLLATSPASDFLGLSAPLAALIVPSKLFAWDAQVAVAAPEPPPPRPTGVRLSVLQVYRT